MGLLATSYINPGKCVNTHMMMLCKDMFYPKYDYNAGGTVPFNYICWASRCGEGLLTNHDISTYQILQSTDVQNVGTNYRTLNVSTSQIINLFSFYYFLQHSIPGYDHYSLSDSEVRTALNNLGFPSEIYCGITTKIQSPWWCSMIPDWGTYLMEEYDDGREYTWDPLTVISNDCTFGFYLDPITVGKKSTGLAFNAPSNYPVPEGWTDAGYRIYSLYVAYPECVKKVRIRTSTGMSWAYDLEYTGYQYDGYSYYFFEWAAGNGSDTYTNNDILRDCEVTAMYIDPPLQTNYHTFGGWIS